jgi:hypothetical protein
MSPARVDSILLGALLDRLGSAQAQALLARLDQWLSRDERDAPVETIRFDRDQLRAVGAPYDRRKQITNANHDLTQERR